MRAECFDLGMFKAWVRYPLVYTVFYLIFVCILYQSFFPQDLQIISTDESQVFVAIQEWYQTETYNLYQSDPQGISYSIVLENVRSTKQPEENVLIDILEVKCHLELL